MSNTKQQIVEVKAAMIQKMNSLEIIELMNLVFKMNKEMTDYADVIVSVGLDALEARMSEAEFVRFCEQMEAAL